MRCTSKIAFVTLRTEEITGAPKEIFGTNFPSITSKWMIGAPAAATIAISFPNVEKSADNTDKKNLQELKAKYRYLIKGAVKLVNVQHRIYLSYKPKHNVLQKIKLLNKKLKAEYTEVYNANDNKAVTCLRACPGIIYIPAAYALRWKLGMR